MRALMLALWLVPAVAAAQPVGPADPVEPVDLAEPVEPADPAEPAPPEAVPAEPPPVSAPPVAPPIVVAAPPPTSSHEATASSHASSLRVGGFIQPQLRFRQNSNAQYDQDGFRFSRARLTALAQTHVGNLELSSYIEAEMQPAFALQDAFATLSRKLPAGARLTVDLGQMRIPSGRQNLLSDTQISFVDKAQIARLNPDTEEQLDRDLGVRVSAELPTVPVKLVAAVFNGEGKNQRENINEKFHYVGRVEVSPFGRDVPLGESIFGGEFLTLGASIGHNQLSPGDFTETRFDYGADVAFAYAGFGGAFEFHEIRYSFDGPSGVLLMDDYKANGWAAQVTYMPPIELPPLRGALAEVGVRIEEVDRNDRTPITQIGDLNQSARIYTGVISYYLRGHTMKLQMALQHFTELEDLTATQQDATYDNDQVLLQATYRLE